MAPLRKISNLIESTLPRTIKACTSEMPFLFFLFFNCQLTEQYLGFVTCNPLLLVWLMFIVKDFLFLWKTPFWTSTTHTVNASFIIHNLFLKAFIFSRCNLVLLVFLMITSIVYLFNKFYSKHENPIFLMDRRVMTSLLLNLNRDLRRNVLQNYVTCSLVSFGRQNSGQIGYLFNLFFLGWNEKVHMLTIVF